MVSELANKQCVPCQGGTPPLPDDQVSDLLRELDGWTVEQEYHLTRTYKLPDFAKSLAFVNRIGGIAEQQNHHPDIYLAWGTVRVEVWTHKIKGLTESDFIFAAKVDAASANDP
ncbi:MAG: 4a-hydroxytetrahydrobiopterin dehydratase [Phycisphaerales bacterium]